MPSISRMFQLAYQSKQTLVTVSYLWAIFSEARSRYFRTYMSAPTIDEGDWLSNTIRMVEVVMVRHGFIDEKKGQRQAASVPQVVSAKRREWIKSLAAALQRTKAS
jgi:hypothetical protein